MHESEINWEILERLRSRFLASNAAPGLYWQSEDDLAHYHATFAARIGWKWDDALASLAAVSFAPASRTLFDWGCGTGIAALRAIARFGAQSFDEVILWDHSTLATRFAQKTIQAAYPALTVTVRTSPTPPAGATVLVSHALNELGTDAQNALTQQLQDAAQILFVEPGTHASSRKLIAQREAFAQTFSPLAPCTHCQACPMLRDENHHHWCHFFAKPPIEAHTESFWSRFAQTMEIDLRSLPYSFLALQRKDASTPPAGNASRLIGRPRQFKGYTRLLSCDESGLRELELQKRDDKALWKVLKKPPTPTLFQWTEIEESTGRLKAGHPL